jgi:hypothetical protein
MKELVDNSITATIDRIWRKYFPPPPEPPPTGRVCAGCHKTIGRNDKWHLLAAKHDDCKYPQGGSPLPPSLERLTNEGAQ